MNGTVERRPDGYRLRFERHLHHPVAKVWAALTEPAHLADWLADATVELLPGGKLQLRFGNTGSVVDGRVMQLLPEKLFEFTWNSEEAAETLVRWELHPTPGGCRLVLTHTFPNDLTLPSMLAGWHTHLEGLPAALGGRPATWPWDRWHELHRMYQQQLAESQK